MHNIVINIYFIFPNYAGIMLNALMTHYAQNYTGIIGGSLAMAYPNICHNKEVNNNNVKSIILLSYSSQVKSISVLFNVNR